LKPSPRLREVGDRRLAEKRAALLFIGDWVETENTDLVDQASGRRTVFVKRAGDQ
jgi:hypothetical protein